MFQKIYDSAWHHPGLCWIAGAPLLLLVAARLLRAREGDQRLFAALLVVFQIEIVLDAWLTGVFTPLTGTAATAAAIAFVILGDLRFFLLLERWGRERQPGLGGAAARALGLSLLVPVG